MKKQFRNLKLEIRNLKFGKSTKNAKDFFCKMINLFKYKKNPCFIRVSSMATVIVFCLCASVAKSNTNYVSLIGNHVSPFDSWENAATNIQDAVDAAIIGDVVLVTDGVYCVTEEISVTKLLTVKSVNGRDVTIVDGGFPVSTNRCFMLKTGLFDIGVTVDGFTVQNGYAKTPKDEGGGIYATWYSKVFNCIIQSNRAELSSGGVYCRDDTIISNCIVRNNHADIDSGGIRLDSGSHAYDCKVVNNSSRNVGGISCISFNIVRNCVIVSNKANKSIGGISCGSYCLAEYCTISGNSAAIRTGGVSVGSNNSTIRYCTISENVASNNAGLSSTDGNIENCIIVSNRAIDQAGGFSFNSATIANSLIAYNSAKKYAGGFAIFNSKIKNCTIAFNSSENYPATYHGQYYNSIVYFNSSSTGISNYSEYASFFNSCTYPLHAGSGNISNFPGFLDSENGDFRLADGSPCIDSGSNFFVASSWDLDGNPRIIDGIVDIGCYESIPEPFSVLLEFTSLACLLFLRKERKITKLK